MMKTVTILLLLVVAVSQTICLDDCCCGFLCEKKNECTDADPCREAAEQPDCCREPAPQEEDQACHHIAPSGEIVSGSIDLELPRTQEEFSIALAIKVFEEEINSCRYQDLDRAPPPRSPHPLFIQISSLRM